MPHMRPGRAARGVRRWALAVGGLLSAALLIGIGAGTAAVPAVGATSTAASPVPTPTTGSPFDEPVGGAGLAAVAEPAVSAGAPPLPVVDATTWLVADLGSGDVLAALEAHRQLPPASTIKLLTALAVLPVIDPQERYTATDDDTGTEGSRVGLVAGQEYTVRDLEHGLLLGSGNDAAHALATLVGGTGRAAQMMNDEAARLGAFDTTATTPDGLDAPGQVSSAYDLALMARAVLADAELATLVRTPTYDFPGLAGETFQIQNRNRLLGSYPGAVGLKTGYTTLAGHTLVAAAERDGTRLVVVALGGEGRAEPAAASLLDWAFAASEAVQPVGTLVTADEVAAAVAERNRATQSPAPATAWPAQQALDEAVDAATGVPTFAWAGLLAALPVAGLIGLAWRRRSTSSSRRTSSGRYAHRT